MSRSKYCPSIVKRICAEIARGTPHKYAAAAVGISEATFYGWASEFPEFLESIERAQALCLKRHLRTINEAAKTDFKAAVWVLERRFPKDFGRPAIRLLIRKGA